MRKITVNLETKDYKRVKSSKLVYDYIMDEDPESTDWNTYIALLLSRTLRAIIEDVTPSDNLLLQQTLVKMHEENPEFVSNFLVNTLKTGGEVERLKETRRKLGFIKN